MLLCILNYKVNKLNNKSKRLFTKVIHSMQPEEIAKLIKAARIKNKYKQPEVAEACGTSKQNIRRYEEGKFKKPDYELLNKIFDFLGIDKSGLPLQINTNLQHKSIINKLHPRNKMGEGDESLKKEIVYLKEIIKLKDEIIDNLRDGK